MPAARQFNPMCTIFSHFSFTSHAVADAWVCVNSLSENEDELDVCNTPIAYVYDTFRSFVKGWEYVRVKPYRTMNTDLEDPTLSYKFGYWIYLRYVVCHKCRGNVGFEWHEDYQLFNVRKKSDTNPLYVQKYSASDSEIDYSEPETENDPGNYELVRRQFVRSHFYS